MSTFYSPKLVTDGLVLCIDAFNSKSYPGTGTAWNDLSNNSLGLNFSGSASYITSLSGAAAGYTWSTGSSNVLDTDTHSIFFKIRFNSTATYPTGCTGGWEKIFGFPAGGSDRSPGIWRWPSNRWIHWRYDPNNSGTDFGKASTSLDAGNEFDLNLWYYVGVTKNSGSTKIYVNGNQVGTGSVSSPKTAGSSSIYLFESYTNPLCNIDNLVIYNRVISDSEALQNYNSLKTRFGI